MNTYKGATFGIAPPTSMDDTFYAIVSKRIVGKAALLEELYVVLDLPGYFGFNWSALYDCLCDFHWINQYKVIIAHEVLPELLEDDLKIYLRILRDAIDTWSNDENHSFEVQFTQADENIVKSLLG
jgi:hypothetical protein